MTDSPPFSEALGPTSESLPPRLREHFVQPTGTRKYRGVMRRVWRRGGWQGWLARPALWLASRENKLFAETGTDVPFEIEHTVDVLPDGRATMTWERWFHFPGGTRQFSAVWVYDPQQNTLIDLLGKGRSLEVELHLLVEGGAVVVRSGRQWMRLGPFRLPRPVWLAGHAEACEWEGTGCSLEVCVTIRSPLLGAFFGYEGSFARVTGSDSPLADH